MFYQYLFEKCDKFVDSSPPDILQHACTYIFTYTQMLCTLQIHQLVTVVLCDFTLNLSASTNEGIMNIINRKQFYAVSAGNEYCT